jgi:MoaA/NifB/PqqE/SkfB family radical SAM enzyme
LDEAKTFIDDLVEIKIPLLMFSGGEPLVRNDIWELLGYARSKGLKTALSSNGVLITKDITKKIKDLGVEYVGISLDGAGEKIHDAVRNQPGSFRKSVQALKNCVENQNDRYKRQLSRGFQST